MATVADLEKLVVELQNRVTDLEDALDGEVSDVTARRVDRLADAEFGENTRPGDWPEVDVSDEDETDG